jgi:hypothetical protein
MKELEKKKSSLNKIYRINIPLSIILGIFYSFYYPYIPRRGGKPPMIEEMEYSEAVIQSGIIFFVILSISFYIIISNKKKKIEELERLEKTNKKNIKQFKSISDFKN